MSYKLDFPSNSKLHPTFHVSCLKAKLGQHVATIPTLPSVDVEGILSLEPIVVLQERSHQLRNRTVTQVLKFSGKGKVLRMLLGRICTSCSNNILTLWARCFNLGGGGIVWHSCMLYNKMGCMAMQRL